MAGRIAVIGSNNVDLVTTVARLPARGETLAGTGFSTGFGGKGANQAVAAARLGSAGTIGTPPRRRRV
ncbi:MAG TPA: PfkB family carbohydrate kinase, partial [Paracoccus solventivorans]|uniref:PfkB family carbohydrate kinase n=1 Tax=Paracoccus solventivorans TaxID=53463 RepID=UPI002CAB5105